MSENKDEKDLNEEQQYDLNDDRRVKVLSPGAMVRKRFLCNRTAVFGLTVLIIMFIFSFIGGLVSPYKQDQLFYKTEYQAKEFASLKKNTEFRYLSADGQDFSLILQSQAFLATTKKADSFEYGGKKYGLTMLSDDLFEVYDGSTLIGIGFKELVSAADASAALTFAEQHEILKARAQNLSTFTVGADTFVIDEEGSVTKNGKDYAFVSEYILNAIMPDVVLTKQFKEELIETIDKGETVFKYTENGQEYEYTLTYNPATQAWSVMQATATTVYDIYSAPSKEHWLGTDKNGMDMLTRLMYGGRVSLVIGFIVEAISTVLGVILGGISGYFGKWVDNLIMRIVDIFYCIPSMPIIIILGAAMDNMRVDPTIRMVYLMLILGFLGWPGIARMVRGQILSLREQEFMTATEATGLRVSRRIFKHLVPNVIPQLIVSVTMGLGGTIITEATLSFLGLGVKFPFASWGNIISDVNDTYVLTHFWFIWIPAGVLLLATVLAFNLVGDGLRDAFDPKMKR